MNEGKRRARGYLATIAIVATVGAMLAAGCGGGKSSADKTATAQAKPAATATKPPATPTAAVKATATAATTGTPSATTPTVEIGQVASIGSVLTNPAGFTLYTYKDDIPNSNQSSVPANIAPNWPPLTVTGSVVAPAGLPGQLGTFTLPDGSMQVTYNGMPLYTFVNDTQPGQANGQGLLNLWYAATP